MIPELTPADQNWVNTFNNISLTPYRLISAGEGPRNIQMPDGSVLSASELKRDLNYPQLFA